jgi:hypothetical protein
MNVGRLLMHTKFWWENQKRRDLLEDLSTDGRVKVDFKE